MLKTLVLPSYSPPTSPKDVIALLPPTLSRHFSALSAPLSHSHLEDSIDLRKDSAKIFAFGHGGIILSPARADSATTEDGSSRTTGYLQVVSTTRRTVKKIVIRIVGRQSIAFPQDPLNRERDETYSKVVVVGRGFERGGGGVQLVQGVNTFEYSIQIPATTCCRVSSPYAEINHFVCGTVVGSSRGVFGKDLQAEQQIWVMSAPASFSSDSEIECFGLDIRAENHTPKLGPFSLTASSSRFIVGGPFVLSLSLHSPPPNLAIYAVVVYIDQTADLTSFHHPSKTAVVRSKLIVLEASGGEKPLNTGHPLKEGTKAMMECRGESGDSAWSFEKVARMVSYFHILPRRRKERRRRFDASFNLLSKTDSLLLHPSFFIPSHFVPDLSTFSQPTDELLQPTTHPSTETSIRFTAELVVKIYYTSFDPMDPSSSTTLLRATLLKRQVAIGCCGCLKTRLSLPNYSEDPSSSVCSLAMKDPANAKNLGNPCSKLNSNSLILLPRRRRRRWGETGKSCLRGS
ncbi:hypothetical protein BDY24DRAFT_87598 [Mrakia frigida]|uniref:uncharacterized protein n=1 Tax=Mrakia frigida TaxID=29902 RepID=UPI003FCBF0C5